MSSRFFSKFDKLAENINGRDDVKLGHVNCDTDADFCKSNGAKGKQISQPICLRCLFLFILTAVATIMSHDLYYAGLSVFLYPDPNGKERVQFKGVKSEEGIAKFLIKNLGDTILVSEACIQVVYRIILSDNITLSS